MQGSIRTTLLLAVVATLAVPGTASAGNAVDKNVTLPGGFTVSGAVRDTHGNPVVGANVQLCSDAECSIQHEALSGSAGAFTVRAVTSGSWRLHASPPEGTNLLGAFRTSTSVGSTNPADAVAFSVASNVSGKDIELPDGLRVSGTVTSPGGQPVEGVYVITTGGGGWGRTDAAGHYELNGLVPGSFMIGVQGPDDGSYPPGVVENGVVVRDDGEGPAGTLYTLEGSDLTGIDFAMTAGRTISGHLSGADGRAVYATAVGSSIGYQFPVDVSGNFTLTGLWPGSYGIVFAVKDVPDVHAPPPFGYYAGEGIPLDPLDWTSVDVTLGDAAGLEPVFAAPAALSGSVRDSSGPVNHALISACDDTRGCAYAVSSADGSWTILNIGAGNWTVTAGALHRVGVWYAGGRSSPHAGDAAPVTVGNTNVSAIDLVLPKGSSISGTVTNAAGTPLSGVDAFAAPNSGGIAEAGPGGAFTDANGHFRVGGLADGGYTLHFTPGVYSAYRGGYWSSTGYTADWAKATTINVSDVTQPVVTAPKASFSVGAQIGSKVPVRVTWSAVDPGSNVRSNPLQLQTNGGSWSTTGNPVKTRLTAQLAPSSTTTYRLRTRATDYEGNVSAWHYGPTFRVLRRQQTATGTTYSSGWTTATDSGASGGTYRVTSTRGASMSFSFTGRAIGWVAPTGPAFGWAKVYIDGSYVTSVDLHADSPSWRRIMFSRSWSSSATHRIRIVNLATAGHAKLGVDAFVVLR